MSAAAVMTRSHGSGTEKEREKKRKKGDRRVTEDAESDVYGDRLSEVGTNFRVSFVNGVPSTEGNGEGTSFAS